MKELGLVHFWMLGVMGVMAVFLCAAVVGHVYKSKKEGNQTKL